MSYYSIGRRPISDTMDAAQVREMSATASHIPPDTRLLEAAQRQLDTLRATMETRLAELDRAMTDPAYASRLPTLIVELAKLATQEAHAATTRACLAVKHESEAMFLESEARHSAALEAERKTSWDHRRALEKTQTRIEELETEMNLLLQASREQANMLEGERAGRLELDRTISTFERQVEELTADLESSRELARDLADERATAAQNVVSLQRQLESVQDAEAASVARIDAFERDLQSARRETDEVLHRLADEVDARVTQERLLAETRQTVADTQRLLEAERVTVTELRSDLTAARAARDADRQAVATLRRAAAEVEAVRSAQAEAVKDREAARQRITELEAELAALRSELDTQRATVAQLRASATGSDEAQASLADELTRLMGAKGTLEAALAAERSRAAGSAATEQDLREALEKTQADAATVRADLAELENRLAALEQARIQAQEGLGALELKLVEAERERDALTLACDNERAVTAGVRDALMLAEQQLSESNAQLVVLRDQLQTAAAAPAPIIAPAPVDEEETELFFDEDDTDASQADAWTGVRAATRYSFAKRIAIDVDGRSGQLINLSTAGCGIRTAVALEAGASVSVELPGEAPVLCEGTVVWARRDGSKRTKAAFRSGIRFTKADATAIEAFIILEADV